MFQIIYPSFQLKLKRRIDDINQYMYESINSGNVYMEEQVQDEQQEIEQETLLEKGWNLDQAKEKSTFRCYGMNCLFQLFIVGLKENLMQN